MKRARRLLATVRLRSRLLLLASGLLAASFLVLGTPPTPPPWWSERGVLTLDAQGQPVPADDFAVANQGQLKHLAVEAFAEFQDKLATVPGGIGSMAAPNGTGYRLTHLIELLEASRTSPGPATNDFAPVNLGQLKNVAAPFYDRLKEVQLFDQYPWDGQEDLRNDFALANLGQLKNLFSFDLAMDSDLDGIPDLEEIKIGTNPRIADTDGDGASDGVEIAAGTNPQDPDTDHDGLTDGAEIALGTDPLNPDTDGDHTLDGQDDFPKDPRRSLRIPVVRYAAIPVGRVLSNDARTQDIGLDNADQVAVIWSEETETGPNQIHLRSWPSGPRADFSSVGVDAVSNERYLIEPVFVTGSGSIAALIHGFHGESSDGPFQLTLGEPVVLSVGNLSSPGKGGPYFPEPPEEPGIIGMTDSALIYGRKYDHGEFRTFVGSALYPDPDDNQGQSANPLFGGGDTVICREGIPAPGNLLNPQPLFSASAQTNVWAVYSGSVFGWTDDPAGTFPQDGDPNAPLRPPGTVSPFLKENGVARDFYEVLNAKFRQQIRFVASALQPPQKDFMNSEGDLLLHAQILDNDSDNWRDADVIFQRKIDPTTREMGIIKEVVLPTGVVLSPDGRGFNKNQILAGAFPDKDSSAGWSHGILVPVEFEVLNWKPLFTVPSVYFDETVARDPIVNVATHGNSSEETFSLDCSVEIKVGTFGNLADLVAARWELRLVQNVMHTTGNNRKWQNFTIEESITPQPGMDYGDGQPQKRQFAYNHDTIQMLMSDSPKIRFVALWGDLRIGSNPLKNVNANHQFMTWIYAENIDTKERSFLKWIQWEAVWDVDFDIRVDVQRNKLLEWRFRKLAEGDGVGPNSPVFQPIQRHDSKTTNP